MKTYRLYLGHKTGNTPILQHSIDAFVENVIDPAFDAFTLIAATGRWKGQAEQSTIVEIITDEENLPTVEHIAAEYARVFHQEAVLLTAHDTQFDLIEYRKVAA